MSSWLVDAAREFGCRAHDKQLYGVWPYTMHLKHVSDYLKHFGYLENHLLAAAYLHDVVEDTDYTLRDIYIRFGPKVAALVSAVTSEPGTNRKDKFLKTYPKILSTPLATALKLADRFANSSQSYSDWCCKRPSKWLMYKKEWPLFREKLKRTVKDSREMNLWEKLEYMMEDNQ